MREKQNQGITLIALVITIIILIILAGVTISMIVGEGGLISRADQAKSDTANATAQEGEQIDTLVNELEKQLNGDANKEFDFNLVKYPDSKQTNTVFIDITFGRPYKEYAPEELKQLTQKQKEEYFLIDYNKESEFFGDPTYATVDEFLQANDVASVEEWIQKWSDYKNIDEYLIGYRVVEFYEYTKPTTVLGGGSHTYADNYDRRYLVTENGEYTFTVKHIRTGKVKTKTIQVTNISKVDTYEMSVSYSTIYLHKKGMDEVEGFQSAYMVLGEDLVNITGALQEGNVAYEAEYSGDLDEGDYTVVIEKDGQLYVKVCHLTPGIAT